MAEDLAEIRIKGSEDATEVLGMYRAVQRGCVASGLGDKWIEIEDCLRMVDASMKERNDKGVWMRKRRKNGDLDLSHPVTVTLKAMEIAGRHKDRVRVDEVLVEAAILHDFFEDFEAGVGVFNVRYQDRVKGARVMELALDVTKGTNLDRRADESGSSFKVRVETYKKKMDDEKLKYEVKDEEDRLLLEHVARRAESGDFRPLVIKLADRIHNMQTVDGLGESAFARTIKQTREEFKPLALRFGFVREAEELEALCNDAEKRRGLNSQK